MAHDYSDPVGAWAMIGEFDSPESLTHAAESAKLAGFRRMDAYSPFPIHGLSEAIGFRDTKVPWTVFTAGLCGLTAGFTLQWWTAVIDYPLNVGGKPLNSLPAFIPVSYEATILISGLSAAIGMFVYNRLPRPYHAVFNAKNFERATRDRFFLAVEVADPNYDESRIRDLMTGAGALEVSICEQ